LRRPIYALAAFVLLLSALFTAPSPAIRAQSGTPDCVPATASGQGGNEDVRKQVILDKIRGHLLLTLPLRESGDYEKAAMHAGHPITELLSIIAGDLRRACFLDTLTKSLLGYANLMGKDSDKAVVEQTYSALLATLDDASARLIAESVRSDPAFNFRVVAGVLMDSRQEYAEGYENGKIVETIEYQDSMGFYLVAKARYDSIRARLSELTSGADKAADPHWATLAGAYASVQPPEKPVDPATLSSAIDSLTSTIAQALKITLEAKLTPLEYLTNAQHSLMEALELYEKGNQDEAYEEAASAYLDQFENVEGPLAEKDKELMETIETQMKAFRDAIKAGKPVSEVQALLAQITPNIEKAITLFS
jgi:hypothetical protein